MSSKSGFNRRSTAEQVTEGVDLSGKTILVTGVNSGLGLESLRVLAKRGAHVIGAARTLEKASEACASVEGKTTPVACELSDPTSVVACADAVGQQFDKLDVILCNAGIMAPADLTLANGYSQPLEMQFATNHMGHFVLVNRLLDLVKKADKGRVVLLSSGGHVQATKNGIEFDNLDCSKGYNPWEAYGQSKLANILMAVELAERLRDDRITANAVHPGVIRTNLARDTRGLMASTISFFATFFERTVEQGAATQCYCAVHPDLDDVTGRYFADSNIKEPSKLAQDKNLAKQLWQQSEILAADYL